MPLQRRSCSSCPHDGEVLPAKPTAAERARTLAAGSSSATLVIPGLSVLDPLSMLPSQRVVIGDADIILRLPVGSPALRAVRCAGNDEVAAVLEITDVAPVAVPDRIRSRAYVAGWLTPVRDGLERGWLKLEVGEVTVEDVWGTELVEPDDFAAAEPDPLAEYEADLLQHLAASHGGELGWLCALVEGRDGDGAPGMPLDVVPLALDRFGLRVRFSDGGGSFDARFQFPAAVTDVAELRRTVRALFEEAWRAVDQKQDSDLA
ncbi:DUF2470 domain-containing protein [Catenulispora rubra]|uniref:DUF2470 domain-containing protein n=1 Tax=Catenulispora rubra TaxID=280293 RepID=UPI001E3A2B87|nr:DUF2470 domain-containing protein [Catenulispora rubra]